MIISSMKYRNLMKLYKHEIVPILLETVRMKSVG